ncbi:DNA polymerase [Paenibacillus sp. MAH-36]|uniref:DNA-directed DNA polymerase n=1 Tax=Paenibacillus violae TaxID=3077234 RepID=A0ABU3R792_9BACL|nr:DNA polymerase [Paenibacillus sp. PFR10]MDU0200144.1 DNA polymerase [Paenibacillus sp. PFR10]
MSTLRIDLETFSSVDIKKQGIHKYVESEDFEILIFAYAFDDEPVRDIDLANFEDIPPHVRVALLDPAIKKTAYNAAFEVACLEKHTGHKLRLEQWECTAVWANYLGLPGYLEGVAKVLNVDMQKDAKGKALIKYFSVPCKPTKVNGGRTRNYPHHDVAKWNEYLAYCRTDVDAERAVSKALSRFPVPDFEWRLWRLDQLINNRGVGVDREFVEHAMACDAQFKERALTEAKELTGLDNPNSGPQLMSWLADEGIETEDIKKDTVKDILSTLDGGVAQKVLKLRQELSKTSVKKYTAISRAVCMDDRLRGTLQFYGANRTGRWAGRIFQPQNLPKNFLKDLELARDIVRRGDYELLEMLYASVPDTLSQLLRTSLIAGQGSRYIVCDFNSIEARVLAWVAGEEWVLDVFKTHGKIYEATAAGMYKVPIEQVAKGSKMRQNGKVAVLACGYGGGVNALIAMGALRDGIPENELKPIVDAWRAANPMIVKLWRLVEQAAVKAVEVGGKHKVRGLITYFVQGDWLFCELPSGRRLSYYKPKLEAGNFGKMQLSHEGVDQETKKWGRRRTWGGTLVENIIQAIARDCLAVSMLAVEPAGYPIAIHVHDEVVSEVPDGFGSVEAMSEIMCMPIPWAPGLPLKAEGYETTFYKKD